MLQRKALSQVQVGDKFKWGKNGLVWTVVSKVITGKTIIRVESGKKWVEYTAFNPQWNKKVTLV